MIATISALEKSSAIAAIIWKPLSSDRSDNDRWDWPQFYLSDRGDRSDRSDHMETTLQRSQRSIPATAKVPACIAYAHAFQDGCQHKHWESNRPRPFYGESTKKRLSLQQIFKGIQRQAQENQLLESNRSAIRLKSWTWVLCLSRLLLCWKTPTITRKHASCKSRRFTVEEWREQCCWTRSPRSSFSDHMETIIRCDRWTIFVSDRSDDSDCSFHMETRLMKWMGLLSYIKKKPFKIPWHPNIRRLC